MPDVNYTALSTPGSTLSAGRYYLTGDATTSGDLEIKGDVYLCLHGHTLDLSGNSISVQPSGTLTLCDCSTDGSGKITTHSSSTVVISNSAVLNLHSGTIENTVENGTASFAVHPYGTFHMYGGEVTSDSTALHNAGTTTVSGGVISGNGGSGTAVIDLYKRQVHRHAGSMGSGTDPSRIFPGKIGAGHMGAEQVTVQNLDVVKVDPEMNMLVVRGAIPGPKGGIVFIKSTVKTAIEKKGEAGTSVNPQKASARVNPQKASARNK